MNDFYSKMVKKNELRPPKLRLKIFQVVAAVHLAVIFLPLSYFILTDYLNKMKKKDVVVVRLIEIPKEVSPKTAKKSGTRRTPKKRSVRKKVKKTIPKKVAEPKMRKVAKKTVSAKKVSKNTVAKKTVSVAKKTAHAKPKYTPPSLPDDLEIIRPQDLKRVPVEEDTADEDEDDDEVGATYTEQLVGVIYKLWNPPSSQLLNGRNPKVLIKIRFSKWGTVLESKIIRKSGFLPMDRSAEELLRNLKQVPPPPKGEATELEFVLVPQE